MGQGGKWRRWKRKGKGDKGRGKEAEIQPIKNWILHTLLAKCPSRPKISWGVTGPPTLDVSNVSGYTTVEHKYIIQNAQKHAISTGRDKLWKKYVGMAWHIPRPQPLRTPPTIPQLYNGGCAPNLEYLVDSLFQASLGEHSTLELIYRLERNRSRYHLPKTPLRLSQRLNWLPDYFEISQSQDNWNKHCSISRDACSRERWTRIWRRWRKCWTKPTAETWSRKIFLDQWRKLSIVESEIIIIIISVYTLCSKKVSQYFDVW